MSLIKCDNCCGWYLSDEYYTHQNKCNKEQSKMTREEAVKIVRNIGNAKPWYEAEVEQLEALGLLKFDEPKKEVVRLCSYEDNELGMVKVEQWPEGLVLWVGGEIRWKSWEKSYKRGDRVTVYDKSFMGRGEWDGIIK